MQTSGKLERLMVTAMRMDQVAWSRHANKWSVRTRIPLGPAMLLALWSHVMIGWVPALLIVALLAVWAILNPHVFRPPADLSSWESRGTLGEQIWLARGSRPIPEHHARAARLLALTSAFGFLLGMIAAVVGNLAVTLAGAAVGTLSKLWFVDRMVWLNDETATRHAARQSIIEPKI